MKKIIKSGFFSYFFGGCIIFSLFYSMSIFAISANEMLVFKDEKCLGFSDQAKTLIKNSRETLLKRKDIFSKKFRQFESIYHTAHLMRMIEGNMFLYGPPGGAKSLFVNWMLQYEKDPAFKIQMHQMMTEQVFIGGQNYEAAKRGEFEVNLKGSLADHKIASIDEIDKGNPATLAALLSLLNERCVYMGSKTFHSPLETIYSTSNKNLYEVYAEFEKNGQGSTAEALLNRFSSIVFIPNWLDKKDQQALDEEHLRKLKSIFNPKQGKIDKLDLELDWDGLRALAHALFVPTDDFYLMVRELVNELRRQSIEFIELQENQYNKDVLPYYPTVQYTERLRQKVIDVILMSLTIDFLTSPLTEDIDALEKTLNNRIEFRSSISPLSLWRAYPILTTVSYGETRLEKSDVEGNISINFGDFLDNYKGENKRANQMIEYIKQERNTFKSALEKIWQTYQSKIKESSLSAAMFGCGDGAEIYDIERVLLVNRK